MFMKGRTFPFPIFFQTWVNLLTIKDIPLLNGSVQELENSRNLKSVLYRLQSYINIFI